MAVDFYRMAMGVRLTHIQSNCMPYFYYVHKNVGKSFSVLIEYLYN